MKKDYSPHIDGLRAVAVMSVLAFHLNTPCFAGGFVGVDVFFVISGYLITRLIVEEIDATGRFSFRNFYIRRFRRLLPALLATLFFTGIAAALLFSPQHLETFGGSLVASLASFSNLLFWREADYFDLSSALKPLLHTWSLSIEEQFYLLWPLFIYGLCRVEKPRRLWLLISAATLSLYLNVLFANGSSPHLNSVAPALAAWFADGRSTIFYLMPFRVFEFAFGAALVWCRGHEYEGARANDFFFLLGLSLVGYSIVQLDESALFPSFAALAPCAGTAMLIYAGARSRFSWLLTNRCSVGIGLLSYSLYLVHWPLIAFWVYATGRDLPVGSRVSIVCLSLVLAFLLHRFVEQPFRRKEIYTAHPQLTFGLAAGIVLVAAVGLHMKTSGGWLWRVTEELAALPPVDSPAEFHRIYYGGAGYKGLINSTKPVDVVLIGDSHGAHYAYGLYNEFVRPAGKSLYVAAGTSCLHLPSFTRTTAGYDWDKLCTESLREALSVISKAEQPPLVVLSHSWVAQMKSAELLDARGKHRGVKVTVGDVIAGIQKLKTLIGSSRLLVIGQVPTTAGRNLYDLLSRPLARSQSASYLTTPVLPEYLDFNRQLAEAGEKSGSFLFLDPHQALCRDGVCRNFDAQKNLIYSDSAHLSRFGSAEVVRAFLRQFQEAARPAGNEVSARN